MPPSAPDMASVTDDELSPLLRLPRASFKSHAEADNVDAAMMEAAMVSLNFIFMSVNCPIVKQPAKLTKKY
jgi:hypothetical protein